MQRLSHVDLLKVLCMYMIVVIHFYTHGLYTVLPQIDTTNYMMVLNFIISELVLLVSSMAVNCFVMISGYFLIVKRPRIARILSIWIETFFYSTIIAFIFYFLNSSTSNFMELVKSFTPIRSGEYWFVTIYIALMLISPFLSRLARSLTKKQYLLLLCLLGFLNLNFFTTPEIVKNIPLGDIYGGSTSLLWFIFLFLVSGYVRMFEKDFKNWYKSRFCVISVLLFFIWTIFLEFLMYEQSGVIGHMGYMYNGLLFFCSFFFFLLFTSIHSETSKTSMLLKCCTKIAPYTFAVYLIHDHPCMNTLVWHTFIDWEQLFGSLFFFPFLFGYTFIIFAICTIISYFRFNLFKVLNINSFVSTISNSIENKTKTYLDK